MKTFVKYWTRGFCLWFLAIVASAALKTELLGIVMGIGLVALLCSYMVFALMRVTRFVRSEPMDDSDRSGKEMLPVMALTTGATRQITIYPRGRSAVAYTEYEIAYQVQGKEYREWFHLYPAPEPAEGYPAGWEVKIACDLNHPSSFEVIEL